MRSEQAAFSSLGLIGSISIGSLLTLGYINLSHYLIAESALEQAARTAVRCVSPTNGDCSNLLQATSQPRWRYSASVVTPSGDVYGQEYDYSAKMFKRQYSAETTFYSIPQEVAPQIELTSFRVPTVQYREVLALKKAELIFQRQGVRQRTFAEPYTVTFPTFDQSFEDAHDTSSFSAAIRDASASQRSVLSRFRLVYSGTFNQSLLGTESEKLDGNYVRYISLSGTEVNLSQLLQGEEVTEECGTGSRCSVRSLAGSNAAEKDNDYKNFRYLSLYLEVELTERSSDASLGIKGPGTTSGLIIDTTGRENSGRICLGGRDVTKLNSLDGKYFNLWLRGPAGASEAAKKWIDKDCRGSYRHSNLIIDVGGSFRPTVNLSLVGQRGDRVQGKVKIYAFADSYRAKKVSTPFVAECPPVLMVRNYTIQELAPAPQECGVSAGTESKIALKAVKEMAAGCYTEADDKTLLPAALLLSSSTSNTFKITDAEVTTREIALAQCNQDAKPSIPSVCGWDVIKGSEKELEFGNVPLEFCRTAKQLQSELSCFDTEKVSSCNVDNLNMASCSAVQERKKQLNDPSSILGLPAGTSNEVSLKLKRGASVEARRTCQQELSANRAQECGAIKVAAVTSLPQFDRNSPSWRPTEKEAYPVSDAAPICNSLKMDAVQPIEGTSQEIVLHGYPFDGEQTLEINDSKPRLNGDKIQCEVSKTNQLTLEERLREYAALSGTQEARDLNLKFEYEAKPLGTAKLVSSTSGCLTNTIALAEGCPKLSYLNVGVEYCGGQVDLGTSESEPEMCKRPGVICNKELDQMVTFPSSERTPTESLNLAAQLARSVMRKFLPQSLSECSGLNCVRVKVNLNSDKTVSADAAYEMPLTWPLNELLGQESLELRKVRTERIEAL